MFILMSRPLWLTFTHTLPTIQATSADRPIQIKPVNQIEIGIPTALDVAMLLNEAVTDNLLDPKTRQPYQGKELIFEETRNIIKALGESSKPIAIIQR